MGPGSGSRLGTWRMGGAVKMNDKTDPRREWESMDGPAQLDAIIGSIYTARKTWSRNGWAFDGIVRDRDSVETIAGEAWPLVIDLIDKTESLGVALYRAVTTAAQRLHRDTMRWGDRTAPAEIEGRDGVIVDLWDAVPCQSPTISRISDPAGVAIVRDAIDRATEDDTDGDIIALLEAGYTVRQIADMLGLSKSTTQRRIDRIRQRLGDPAELYAALA